MLINDVRGVNDANSLKQVNCVIAVEGSSEAAQAAADMVFIVPGLSTIILSIKTSRQIFQRMVSPVKSWRVYPTLAITANLGA